LCKRPHRKPRRLNKPSKSREWRWGKERKKCTKLITVLTND
jgi:hypothetical protein